MNTSICRDTSINVGLLLFLLLSLVPIFLKKSNNSYSSYDKPNRILLFSNIVAASFLSLNYMSILLVSKKSRHTTQNWKSASFFVAVFFISDLIILFSEYLDLRRISELQFLLTGVQQVGVAASIVNTDLLNHFPKERLSMVGYFTSTSLFLIIVGQSFRVGSQLAVISQQNLFGIISLCFLVAGTFTFGCSCYIFYKPLWLLTSDAAFRTIKPKIEFIRITVLIANLFITASLNFYYSDEGILLTLVLQVVLFYILNGLSLFQYQKTIQEKENKLLERMDLTRYISHEMRTPLNSAAIGTSLALDTAIHLKNVYRKECLADNITIEDLSPSKSKSLENIVLDQLNTLQQVQDSCTVAVATLDDILTFDKLSEGKLVTEFKDLNPFKFLTQSTKSFVFNAREKEIDLQFDFAEEELANLVIRGDHFKLGQVIRNLLSNALKFTPVKGTVEMKVEVLPPSILLPIDEEEGDDGNDMNPDFHSVLRISVKDSGVGISAQNQRKLFKQYVQIRPGELQEGKGSGLGLWITKKIVDLHKGNIGVFSCGEGHGTTFFFDLPLFPVSSPEDLLAIHLKTSFAVEETSISRRSLMKGKLQKGVIERPIKNNSYIASYLASPLELSSSKKKTPRNSFQNYKITPDDTLDVSSDSTEMADLHHSDYSIVSKKLTQTIVWEDGINFLVVDDALSNRKLTKKALERCGHFVEVAVDGQDCIDFMENLMSNVSIKNLENDENQDTTIQVILMDDSMPKMTGVEATARLRSMGYKGLIFGVTGDVETEKYNQFMENGANGVFSKPLDLLALQKLIEK